MRTESCRAFRESLGAYALGQLKEAERIALEAHLEGCGECRGEADSLLGIAALLPAADPQHFGPPPAPPPALGAQIAARIEAERQGRRRADRRRFRALLGAGITTAAAAAAVVIILALGGSSGAGPQQEVVFGSLPPGVKISASLSPRAFGTEIEMYVSGIRSGTLCRVFLRGPGARRVSAGTFRYRYGADSEAQLSSALDLSQTKAVGVRAGGHTYVEALRGAVGA